MQLIKFDSFFSIADTKLIVEYSMVHNIEDLMTVQAYDQTARFSNQIKSFISIS